MRPLIAVTVLALTACGGANTETSDPSQAEACAAAEQIIAIAADAYEARNGERPESVEQMVGTNLEDQTFNAWFVIDGGAVVAAEDGPCD